MIRALFGLALLFAPVAASAQSVENPAPTIADIQAMLPQPASAVPPAETVAGSAGAGLTYRRGDAVQPRITRSTTCTLDGTASCSVTWTTAMSGGTPTISITPINAGSNPIACNLTSAPTTTTVAIKCWISQTTLLNLSLITAGLTLQPFQNALAGTQVQIIALPSTQ